MKSTVISLHIAKGPIQVEDWTTGVKNIVMSGWVIHFAKRRSCIHKSPA